MKIPTRDGRGVGVIWFRTGMQGGEQLRNEEVITEHNKTSDTKTKKPTSLISKVF